MAGKTPEWLATILALVLPFPERQDYQRQAPVDVPFWSFVAGLGEFIGGAVLLVHNGLVALTAIAERNAAAVMGDPSFFSSKENTLAYMWSGSFNVLEWIGRPTTLILISIPIVGMARLVAYAASREPSGEFFAWLFVRIRQLVRGRRQALAEKARFGPRRPDRLVEEPGCDLVLLTSVRQEEWNEYVTIEIDERFYKLIGQEERRLPGEAWSVYAYRLAEEPENAVIRRLLRYEPAQIS